MNSSLHIVNKVTSTVKTDFTDNILGKRQIGMVVLFFSESKFQFKCLNRNDITIYDEIYYIIKVINYQYTTLPAACLIIALVINYISKAL